MKLLLSILLLISSQILLSCGSSSIATDMDKADKIVTNQAAPLSLKAKLMAREGSTIRSPASLSATDIEANTDPAYDLISSITGFKSAGHYVLDDVSYNVGILTIGIGPDLNPQALVLVVNAGLYDSLAFALPTYAIEIKKVSVKGNEIRAKILQRTETDKSPYYKDSPLCFTVKLAQREADHQNFIAKKATFIIGECKEF